MASISASPDYPRPPPLPKPTGSGQVHVTNRQRTLSINADSVRIAVQTVLEREGQSFDGVGVIFLGLKAMQKLHDEAFGDPSPTDCMSFPLSHGPGPYLLGDVYVCPEVAQQSDRRAPYRELTLYVIHGLLHLLGYDDQATADRRVMVRRQNAHLRWLSRYKKLIKK